MGVTVQIAIVFLLSFTLLGWLFRLLHGALTNMMSVGWAHAAVGAILAYCFVAFMQDAITTPTPEVTRAQRDDGFRRLIVLCAGMVLGYIWFPEFLQLLSWLKSFFS